jgi:hypothetical protein
VTGDDEKGLRIREIITVHPNTKIITGNGFCGRVQDTPLRGISFTVKIKFASA